MSPPRKPRKKKEEPTPWFLLGAAIFLIPLVLALLFAANAYRYVANGVPVMGTIDEFICASRNRRPVPSDGGLVIRSGKRCAVVIVFTSGEVRHAIIESNHSPEPGFEQGDAIPLLVIPSFDQYAQPDTRIASFWALWGDAIKMGIFSLPFMGVSGLLLYFVSQIVWGRPKKRERKSKVQSGVQGSDLPPA